jgi:hypothetical protein
MKPSDIPVKSIELKKGKFEVYRIGNMRFERLSDCGEPGRDLWIGFVESGDKDIPIFARKGEGFTLEEIRECWESTGKFLESVEKKIKKKKK